MVKSARGYYHSVLFVVEKVKLEIKKLPTIIIIIFLHFFNVLSRIRLFRTKTILTDTPEIKNISLDSQIIIIHI